MKITPAKFTSFLKELNFQTKSILVFGPENTLIAFKVNQILESLSKLVPFQTIRLDVVPKSVDELLVEDQPSLFENEILNKVYVISHVKDNFLKDLEDVSDQINDSTLFILQGQGLPTSSKLVKFHEKEPAFFCVGVYEQTIAERKEFVQRHLSDHKLQISPQDLNYLTEIISPDPILIGMEIEKLSLYVGEGNLVTLEGIKRTIAPEVSEEVDQFLHFILMGDRSHLLKSYRLLKQNGQEDIMILRTMSNHIIRLLQVSSQIKSGVSTTSALETLRPRLFFKTKDRFMAHLGKWSPEGLYKALDILRDIEMQMKTHQHNLESYCSRGFLKISTLIGR